jgi:peptide/nickel transport system ATP-binding protein
MTKKLLEIKDLVIQYHTCDGVVEAVNGISFDLAKGETIGIVGETGAGKTTTALGILNMLPDPPGKIMGGSIRFNDEEIIDKTEKEMHAIRGKKISMIFQDPMTALNPVLRIGEQIEEVILLHNKLSKATAQQRMMDLLNLVGIDPRRATEYPHQFSGGMKQRVLIAIALACSPELLIADEPTTALDVTIQAQILELMDALKKEFGTAICLITHDLGVVAQICDKVAVMYAGEIVEKGSLAQIFEHTAHPYTIGLFESIPSLDCEVDMLKPIPGCVPNPKALPTGCKFHPRCPIADALCAEKNPGHFAKCHYCGNISSQI